MPRPRKPTELHKIEGTYRRHRHDGDEPKPPSGTPSCPRELDKAAKAEWRRLAPLLAKLGLLTEMDRAMLASYCSAWARWCKAEAEIAARGEVVETPNGCLQKSPWCNVARDAFQQLEKAASHFGLSPSARTKVRTMAPWERPLHPLLGGAAARDDFDRLIDGDDPAERFFS